MNRRHLLQALAAAALPVPLTAVHAADTTTPLRIVVPFGVGAMVDAIPREFAPPLAEVLGRPVLVENRPGAASMVGAERVARARPDGLTVLMATSSTLSVAPHIYKNLSFDPLKDLTPLLSVGRAPNLLMVSSRFAPKTWQELLDTVRAQPGQFAYASAGVGGILHLQGEQFLQATGLKMIHTPYPGSQQAVADLATNRVQMMIDILPSNRANLESGTLRALAVMGRERLPQLPDVPTIVELGHPELVADIWFGLAVPAATPPETRSRLAAAIAPILKSPGMVKKYADLGFELTAGPEAQLREWIDRDGARWSGVIRRGDIRIEG